MEIKSVIILGPTPSWSPTRPRVRRSFIDCTSHKPETGLTFDTCLKRFIITVLVLTVLHAVGCVIAPPFEFGRNRTECFCFALGGGLWGFSLISALLLWPLQWGLRRLMPPQMRRTQAVLAGLTLLGLVAAWVFTHPTLPHQHGFYVHWLACSMLAIVASLSFFWPLGMDGRSSKHDHPA